MRSGALARALGVDELLAVGDLARDIADGATDAPADTPVDTPQTSADDININVRWVNDTDAAFDVLEAELRQGDVVLLKSSRDSGLRHLGDRLLPRIDSEVGS